MKVCEGIISIKPYSCCDDKCQTSSTANTKACKMNRTFLKDYLSTFSCSPQKYYGMSKKEREKKIATRNANITQWQLAMQSPIRVRMLLNDDLQRRKKRLRVTFIVHANNTLRELNTLVDNIQCFQLQGCLHNVIFF